MSKGLILLSERLVEAEQQCALALAKAQQDLKLFMEQQNALNQYRQIYHQQWTDRGLQGISPQQNAQYHAFINKLEQAATQQYEGGVAGAAGAGAAPRRVAGSPAAAQGGGVAAGKTG